MLAKTQRATSNVLPPSKGERLDLQAARRCSQRRLRSRARRLTDARPPTVRSPAGAAMLKADGKDIVKKSSTRRNR